VEQAEVAAAVSTVEQAEVGVAEGTAGQAVVDTEELAAVVVDTVEQAVAVVNTEELAEVVGIVELAEVVGIVELVEVVGIVELVEVVGIVDQAVFVEGTVDRDIAEEACQGIVDQLEGKMAAEDIVALVEDFGSIDLVEVLVAPWAQMVGKV
jgi:hypothetical protein